MTAVPARVQRIVDKRDDFTDRMTGHLLGQGRNLHHRQLRSQGGKHAASNLVTLSGSGTVGSHGFVHAYPASARLLGYIVPSFIKNVSAIPLYVTTAGGWCRWVRFDDAGHVFPMDDDAVYDVMFNRGIWTEPITEPWLLGPTGGRLARGGT